MAQSVLLAANISENFRKFLDENNYVLLESMPNQKMEKDKIIGIITSTKIPIDKAFIDSHPNLKWVARLGSGLEIIDIAYCKTKNIFVCNAPKGIASSVAEHCLSMLIALQKNIIKSHMEVANGFWIREANRGWELSGKTLALIGYGHTAQAFAKLLTVFDVKILAFDIHWNDSENIFPNVQKASLQQIYEHADIVSYHVPLKADTINYYKSSSFQKAHILINTSRGAVCPTTNIIEGFKSEKLIGACLDVLDFEHIQPFTKIELAQLNNLLQYPCMITPHIAGYSYNAIHNMCDELIQKLKLFFDNNY
jgi:D-3-phosphoglycerate dehydrogenase / 2-oxoglutarate reductase